MVDSEQNIIDSENRVIVPCVQGHDVRSNAFSRESGILQAKDDGGAVNAAFICKAVNYHEKLLNRVKQLELVLAGLSFPPN
jgi:hypothetical protein